MSTTEQSTTLLLPDPTQLDAPDGESGLDPVETAIRLRSGWVAVDWSEMLRARELLYYCVARRQDPFLLRRDQPGRPGGLAGDLRDPAGLTAWDIDPVSWSQYNRDDMGVPRFVEELRRAGYPVMTFPKDCGVSIVQPRIGGIPLQSEPAAVVSAT